MSKKRYIAEEIISKLREAEILLSQGLTVAEAAQKMEIHEQTYYRWKKEYGGLDKCQTLTSCRTFRTLGNFWSKLLLHQSDV